ncbi:hypothetical protein D9M68_466420 [compost metagenome]
MGLSQLPSALTESLCRMPVPPQSVRASDARNSALGFSSWYTTVWASGASTPVTFTVPRPSNSLAQRQPDLGAV